MCSYCSPKFSSQWQDSVQQHGKFKGISASANNNLEIALADNKTDYWIDQLGEYLSQCPDNSVSIKLLGGEPLMQKQNLQQLLELNSSRVSKLVINTNLNPPSNKFLIWVLEKFPRDKLQFEISLDASPEYNAVPRAGFDCNRFYHNLELLKQHQIEFVFLSVVSVLSVFDITNFQHWLSTNGYTARFFNLNNPDCLDAKYLPDSVKQSVWKESLPDVAKQALLPSNLIDLKLFEQYNYLKQYFDRTNVDHTQNAQFASYWDWLTERYK
jgi:sulfatase maturation enzyme AslB (radical SAM superfamily)